MFTAISYGIAAIVGVVAPLSSVRWAGMFIVATAFDDLRPGQVSISNIAMVAFIARWVTEYLSGHRLRASVVSLPLASILFISIVATLAADRVVERIPYLLSVAMLIIAASALASVGSSPTRAATLLRAVLWMSGIVAASVIAQSLAYYVFGFNFDTVYYLINLHKNALQASGIFGSNALAALHLVPGLVIGAVLRSRSTGKERRRLNVYVLFIGAAIVATFSRAALVATVILMMLLTVRRVLRRGWGRAAAAVALLLILVLIPNGLRFLAGFNVGSLVTRYAIVVGAIDAVRARPLFGSGPGSKVTPVYPRWTVDRYPDQVYLSDPSTPRDTHNTVLQIAIDFGAPGLLAFAWIQVVLIRRIVSASRRTVSRELSLEMQAALSALLITESFALFDSVLYTKPVWILIGVTTAIIGAVSRAAVISGVADLQRRLRFAPT